MHKIILDTDYSMGHPGSDVDDGLALALAFAEPGFDLRAVTTVFGNAPVAACTELATEGIGLLGGRQSVTEGAAGPFLFGDNTESAAPGSTGRPRGHAAIEIRDRVLDNPGDITIVAIGPLTNIALALMLEPDIARHARELVVMGGAFATTTGTGLTWPGEFNVWNDPVAAQIVLDSGIRQRWIGLDVTTRVTFGNDDITMLDAGHEYLSRARSAVVQWIDFLAEEYPGQFGVDEVEVHDATALASLVHPEMFTWTPAYVRVGTEDNATRGITVADFLRAKNPRQSNCVVATDVDAPALKAYLLEHFALLNTTPG